MENNTEQQNVPPASQAVPPPMPTATQTTLPTTPKERQWAVILHVSAFAGFFIPFGNIIAPLVIWLIKKQEMPCLDQVGKDVLNFQISWAIWSVLIVVIGGLVIMLGSCIVGPFALLLVPIFFIFSIAWLVFIIQGAVKASNGEAYEFPGSIPFLA